MHHLTEEERKVYANQTIPSLYETLVMLRDANMSFMFDFMYQPHWMHGADTPYRLFAQIVQQANFPPEKVSNKFFVSQKNEEHMKIIVLIKKRYSICIILFCCKEDMDIWRKLKRFVVICDIVQWRHWSFGMDK